jgi:hypothetical protein
MYVSELKRLFVRPCILNFKPNIWVGFRVGTSFSQFTKFNFNVIFCNFQKVQNRTNSKFSVNSECSETPVSKLFDPKTGNYFWIYFPTIFAKFLRVQKDRIFLKKFWTLKTDLFWNLQKQKVQKIPSNAGP